MQRFILNVIAGHLIFIMCSCENNGVSQNEDSSQSSTKIKSISTKAPKCSDIEAIELNKFEDPPLNKSGVFKHCQSNGLVLRFGKAVNGKKQGKWLVYHENGELWYECEFDENGNQNGTAKWYSNEGKLLCTEAWEAGKLVSTDGTGC